jgi:carbonic anhydrase
MPPGPLWYAPGMPEIGQLFENNRRWAESLTRDRPDFFAELEAVQRPEYVWIGCSDSRVPANDIIGLLPGELFVHRNVANVVSHTDLNCLSVLQFAIEALHVRRVIVCGHYGCGGVRAALENARLGLIDNWLRHVQDVRGTHRKTLEAADPAARLNLLCELNVVEQARHVCETTVVQDAWARGQSLAVHGWIYALSDGRLRDLGFSVDGPEALEPAYARSVAGRPGV